MHCDMLIGSCCENLEVRRVVVCAALQGGACVVTLTQGSPWPCLLS
jgi:hypothetical protein